MEKRPGRAAARRRNSQARDRGHSRKKPARLTPSGSAGCRGHLIRCCEKPLGSVAVAEPSTYKCFAPQHSRCAIVGGCSGGSCSGCFRGSRVEGYEAQRLVIIALVALTLARTNQAAGNTTGGPSGCETAPALRGSSAASGLASDRANASRDAYARAARRIESATGQADPRPARR